MTRVARRDQVRRVRPSRSRPAPQPPSTVLAALWAASSAALAGVAIAAALVLLAWGADDRSTASTGGALWAALQVWLLAHHGTLELPTGQVGLLPLGLSLLPGVLLLRSGTSLARVLRVADLASAGRATAMLSLAYAVLVAVLAGFSGTGTASVTPFRAMLWAVLLAATAGGVGVLRGAGLGRRAFRAMPAHARLVLRGACAATGVLVAGGALLAGAALALDFGGATGLARALATGVASGAALLVLGLLYAPNAAVWGAAYTTGPGFAVGSGTSVSVFGVTLGPVPAFPLLAALPEGRHAPAATWPFLLVPVAAGVVAGAFVAYRLGTGDYGRHRPGAAGLWALASGWVCGLLFALVAALSGGPLGTGRLAAVGPSPWQVGLCAATEVGLVAGGTAFLLRWDAERRAGRGGGGRSSARTGGAARVAP